MNEYMSEQRTSYQRRIDHITEQYEKQLKMAKERLHFFEKNAEFDDILKCYNDQMAQVEDQNAKLGTELKKLF